MEKWTEELLIWIVRREQGWLDRAVNEGNLRFFGRAETYEDVFRQLLFPGKSVEDGTLTGKEYNEAFWEWAEKAGIPAENCLRMVAGALLDSFGDGEAGTKDGEMPRAYWDGGEKRTVTVARVDSDGKRVSEPAAEKPCPHILDVVNLNARLTAVEVKLDILGSLTRG